MHCTVDVQLSFRNSKAATADFIRRNRSNQDPFSNDTNAALKQKNLKLKLISFFFKWEKCIILAHFQSAANYPDLLRLYCRTGAYQDDQIYAKVDDMTYYPVNNMLVSLPNTGTNSTTNHSNSSPPLPSCPPPVSTSKTLHHPRAGGEFQAFGTVHRSQKIYL